MKGQYGGYGIKMNGLVERGYEAQYDRNAANWAAYMRVEIRRFQGVCALLKANNINLTHLDTLKQSIPQVSGFRVTFGKCARELGLSLAKNTVVSSIVVDLFLLRTENIWSEERDINKIQRNNAAPLLKFLETGPALTSVTLRDKLGEERFFSEARSREWSTMFCEAMAKNPKLSVLCLDASIQVSPDIFLNVLQAATSLTSLEFGLPTFGSRVDGALPTVVAQAIAARSTLKTLRLHIAATTAVGDVALLTQLGELRVPLQELHLVYHHNKEPAMGDSITENVTAQMQAVESVLHFSTTLHRLTLDWFHFDKASMDHLLAGLSANRSVTALSFVGLCHWEPPAARAFLDYLQRPVENDEQSPLKELHVNDLTAFEGFTLDTVLEEMLTVAAMPNELLSNTCRTIGSSIQSLETSGSFLGSVLDTLARNARTMRLGTVRVSTPGNGHELEAFHRNLPMVLCLKDLTIGQEKNGSELLWDRSRVLDALRANGSLVRLSLNQINFTAPDKQRLDAYLQRNESLPLLLANPPPLSGGTAKNTDGPLDLSLFPSLFDVSKSMPAMSANTILVGLLAAAGNIGPSTLDAKRAGHFNR
jgi:hypothetical protein